MTEALNQMMDAINTVMEVVFAFAVLCLFFLLGDKL